MKFREKKPFIISLKFGAHLIRAAQFIRAAHFPHPGSISTSRQLKNVILFLFDFKKSSCLGERDSHFCLVYGKVYLKKIFFIHIIPRTRARKFSGAHFPHPRCGK